MIRHPGILDKSDEVATCAKVGLTNINIRRTYPTLPNFAGVIAILKPISLIKLL
jgi:hypothetical protein